MRADQPLIVEAQAATGVRYPVEGMTSASCVTRIERFLGPIVAAGATVLSSVTVVSNALRLRRFGVLAARSGAASRSKAAPAGA